MASAGWRADPVLGVRPSAVQWKWGPVISYKLALEEIESTSRTPMTVMELILAPDVLPSTREMLLDSFMGGGGSRPSCTPALLHSYTPTASTRSWAVGDRAMRCSTRVALHGRLFTLWPSASPRRVQLASPQCCDSPSSPPASPAVPFPVDVKGFCGRCSSKSGHCLRGGST